MSALALKWRLSIPVAIATALGMILICALSYNTFREMVLTQADQSLISAVEGIGIIMDDPATAKNPLIHIRALLAAMVAHEEEEDRPNIIVRVWKDSGSQDMVAIDSEVVMHELKDLLSQIEAPYPNQQILFDLDSSHGVYRTVWKKITLKDGISNIIIAQETGPLYNELHDLLVYLVLTTLGIVVTVIMMSSGLVMLGLRSIHKTAQELERITIGDIKKQNQLANSVPAELEPFVCTVIGMLDRLNETIYRQKMFIADAAHELRTPIAVAKSTLEVTLVEKRSLDEYRQALRDTSGDLLRLEHLVNELLVLARLDEGQNVVQAPELDLTRLLSDIAESFQPRVLELGGTIVCDLVPAQVQGDLLQFQTLFSNLLENALRHGPQRGEIKLVMSKQSSTVSIIVWDQGGRIPPKDLPHLFERFYRCDKSRTQSTGGTGLGLAIAKAIVVNHGGDIKIDSSPAMGTCVQVTLPRNPVQPKH